MYKVKVIRESTMAKRGRMIYWLLAGCLVLSLMYMCWRCQDFPNDMQLAEKVCSDSVSQMPLFSKVFWGNNDDKRNNNRLKFLNHLIRSWYYVRITFVSCIMTHLSIMCHVLSLYYRYWENNVKSLLRLYTELQWVEMKQIHAQLVRTNSSASKGGPVGN